MLSSSVSYLPNKNSYLPNNGIKIMIKLSSAHVLRCTLLMICLSILLPGLLWAAGGAGEAAWCPGTPERQTAFDPACGAGLQELDLCDAIGATGCDEPQTGISGDELDDCVASSCWDETPPCGGLGQRACCGLGDGIEVECDAGLEQYFNVDPDDFGLCDDYAFGCLCGGGNNDHTNTSNGYCQAITDCGGAGERACCPGEPDRPTVGADACPNAIGDEILVEQLGCVGLGCGCSSSTCKVETACGGAGQRACCPGEPGRPALGNFACPNGNGVVLAEVAAAENPLFFCGSLADFPGIATTSVCEAVEPCGGVGQRACCLGEREGLEVGGCQADLVEAPG